MRSPFNELFPGEIRKVDPTPPFAFCSLPFAPPLTDEMDNEQRGTIFLFLPG